MGQLLNQHSFVAVVLLVLAIAWVASRRLRRPWRFVLLGALAGAGAVAFLSLRIGAGDVRSTDQLSAALRGGKPVALELYSDY